ncbi:MAG: hypothetical protein EA397_10760 [Deltaproteobacteria bacterium]|nr:MAG: hypothetical protein EA397_10760 [Deltaproteobacteria bacterium]
MSGGKTVRQLFKEWRSGDAEAGQIMAQRVADWYYAISTSRLGEDRGKAPCDEACAEFGGGIVNVSDGRKVEGWAHDIITQKVKAAGSRATDGDKPSLYTRKQAPKGLLRRARAELPEEVTLLEAVYGAQADRSQIAALAEPLGGNPLGILEARYRVKRWLRDNAKVKFDVVPDKPILDRAPLPLYEADRMASSAEEAQFELWMLTDLDLCKDIAEFAHFSIALRGGLPARGSTPKPAPAAKTPPDTAGGEPHTPAPSKASGASKIGLVVGVVAVLVLLGLLAVAGLGAFFFVLS